MNLLDSELLPVSEIAGGLLDLPDQADEAGCTTVEVLRCDLPVELLVEQAGSDDAATVTVRLSPPRQPIITTVMPVFHRLRITVVRDADD
ncbi:hypothetical protein [Ornithinimicrobium sufpigmenti]|uniref:hypothetical protein n=1 Tax=Ornithinimicrobium sufpigmenti TaxID=2508882 RepID=UPI001035BE34|nr:MULTISPECIES: hypothetical protein [unclassified Ornithinimicrobium]